MKCQHFERRQTPPVTRREEIMKLWRDVAVAVASSSNANKKESMAGWAYQAVNDYSEFVCKIEKARSEK